MLQEWRETEEEGLSHDVWAVIVTVLEEDCSSPHLSASFRELEAHRTEREPLAVSTSSFAKVELDDVKTCAFVS